MAATLTRGRHSSAAAQQTEADEETIKQRTRRQPQSMSVVSSITSRIPNPLLLTNQLLTKLETIPRRVIHRTLDLVVPTTHHHSATVQRVLQQDASTAFDVCLDVESLKVKYAKEIKANAEVQSIQKQIRSWKQQIQQQRLQRERLEKKQAAQRERDQKNLEQLTLKFRQALQATSHKSHRRDYTKALTRASSRRHTTTSIYNMISLSSSSHHTGANEKEALQLETTILRCMHRTLAYQNQIELAQIYTRILESTLKQERATLGDELADWAKFQMVLEGTQRALTGLYPEILSRQKGLLEKMQRKRITPANVPRVAPQETAQTESVPPQVVLSPSVLRTGSAPLSTSVRSDGISDLGESLIADSVTETESIECNYYHCGRRGGPVFTSVHTLQQRTLQQLAGVQTY